MTAVEIEAREVAMVGDGTWLTVREAAERFGYYQDKVRGFADAGYLRVMRPPSEKGQGHRRILAASIPELQRILEMPDGDEKTAALAALRRRNLGIPDPE